MGRRAAEDGIDGHVRTERGSGYAMLVAADEGAVFERCPGVRWYSPARSWC